MSTQPVYIVSATRTPIGSFLGSLSELTAPQLGAVAVKAAVERSGIAPELINEVFLGNVLSAGIGQAPARQASLAAGLSNKIPCTTVSKVCGSGLQAVIFGQRAVALGEADVVVVGGMESMSNAPYYLKKARSGYRMGDGALVDGMIFDGLWDPYNNYHMGNAGELCARELNFSREAQDEFAKESYRRAIAAQKEGLFADELAAVSVPQKKGDALSITEDEEPGRGNPSKMGSLRAAFTKDGTITAANASKINDGASALVLASERAVKEHKLTPLARIVGHGAAAQAPEWFTTAPAVAIDQTTERLKIAKSDIDLYEVNEAFAVVAMAVAQKSGLDLGKVNINGGAVALGHPIGSSGARILVTLTHALKQRGLRRGLASICIGGGEALALVIER